MIEPAVTIPAFAGISIRVPLITRIIEYTLTALDGSRPHWSVVAAHIGHRSSLISRGFSNPLEVLGNPAQHHSDTNPQESYSILARPEEGPLWALAVERRRLLSPTPSFASDAAKARTHPQNCGIT